MDFSSCLKAGNEAFGDNEFATCYQHYINASLLEPDHAILNANLAAVLFELGRFEESETYANRAIELKPDYNRSHITLGMLYLQKGDYQRGWPEYEWTSTLFPKFQKLPQQRKWKGEAVNGQSIAVIDEQGYGDTIHFIRFTENLLKNGAKVYLDVKPPLRRLFASNPQFGTILEQGQQVDIVKWTRLLSIPRYYQLNESEFSNNSPYLKADPLPHDSKIQSDSNLKIGIIWKGSDANSRDTQRSIPLEKLEPLLSLSRHKPGLSFYHLHYQDFTQQIKAAGLSDCILSLHDELGDFSSQASIMDAMHLIITVDTSIAHLAGALGKKTFCMLPKIADWRWGQSGSTTCWYPTMQLFRQPTHGDWDSVVQEVVAGIHSQMNLNGNGITI